MGPALPFKDITPNYIFGLQSLILASLLPWGCQSPRCDMYRGISKHQSCLWLLSSAPLPLGLFPRGLQGMRKAPIWGSKSRKERSTASHAGAQTPSPQTLQGSVLSLLPFNLIHMELPNFKLTPSASRHLFHIPTPDSDTPRGHEFLYLCKHTRAPSSSSKPSQLHPLQPW